MAASAIFHVLIVIREPSEDESSISPEFLKELQENPPMEVKFMGGEPLLYMTEIKKVVETLPNARFSISINSMGIEKHLDYFRKHDFLICISYDGAERISEVLTLSRPFLITPIWRCRQRFIMATQISIPS